MAADAAVMPSATDGFLTGQILIAMPGIGDPRFERALVLLCAHDQEHAMGLAVNRPVDGLTLPDLLGRLGVETLIEVPADLVLMGGPVQRERGFVLHTGDFRSLESTLPVADDLGMTATRDALDALAGQRRRPRRATLCLGYAGWGEGQLERELRDNVWLTCPADEELVFGDDHEEKWAKALHKIGVDPEFLSMTAGRA